ncbi:DNA gyrase subunit A-like [Rattus rattus]|uniref:DNA gyrase subunit A-like n=1 Tax=Rattus rattus TaxID=10117 RepID=UPI0013F38B52|nr:DNA gyrase subunit A-like [Rattus rattus]
MEGSFLEYSMSVIKSRALPDYRDGLKPVHRRIIFAANKDGLTHDKRYKKSAAIVGSVMGSYHPHGDMSIYDALVRMSQDFSMRYPLIDGQGNFGSIDGDSPAAMRYTEARLSKISSQFVEGLDEDWVEMHDNYDQSKKEPAYLPTLIPNVLVNGSEGIAVGLATKIPPHNLSEVLEASIALINNPNLTVEEMHQYIKGPDFPTGGSVLNQDGVKRYFGYDVSGSRKKSFRIRGKVVLEQEGEKKGKIIITEIPYGVKKSAIISQIVNYRKDEKAKKGKYRKFVRVFHDYITAIRDESSIEGIRVVIEYRGCPGDVVLNNLYKHTSLQISYAANPVVLVNKEPKRLSVLDLLSLYVEHQRDILRNRAAYRIKVLEKRIHILEGRLRVVADIMEAIHIITTSDTPEHDMMSRYQLDEAQVRDIFDLKIGRLKKLSIADMESEKKEKMEERDFNVALLASEEAQKEELIKRLTNIKETYQDERRTDLLEGTGEISHEDTQNYESMVLILTKNSYLTQIP